MIEVTNLVKAFPKARALDNVSFTVGRGEIFGIVGPNGAGKTTCLNILATLMRPTDGKVLCEGRDIFEDIRGFRRSMGYMPDFFGTFRNLTFHEYLDFFGGCHGMPYRERMRRIDEVIELTNLGGMRHEIVDNLSRGTKQRLCLAKTLLHNPKVLLLDEPASGLDPKARREIRDALSRTRAERGATVLISSHILSELEQMCTDIAIIDHGRVARRATMRELLAGPLPRRRWVMEVSGDPVEAARAIKALEFVESAEVQGRRITAALSAAAAPEEPGKPFSRAMLEALLAGGADVIFFSEEKTSLEDVYLRWTDEGGAAVRRVDNRGTNDS